MSASTHALPFACAISMVVAAWSFAPVARADEREVAAEPGRGDAPVSHEESPAERPPDRPIPDYDGLPDPGDDGGDVLLWTARILTSPLYLLTEFGIRRPLGWLIVQAERNHVLSRTRAFLTFGPNDNIGLFPTFFWEFGFQPTVGIYGFWEDFLVDGNRLSTHGAFGGIDWLAWSLSDRFILRDRWSFGEFFQLLRRPDFVFGGIGPNATLPPRARFTADRVEAQIWTRVRWWHSSDIEVRGVYRNVAFHDRPWNGDPSVLQRTVQNNTPIPFGYLTGYDAAGVLVEADVDTRIEGGEPQGGFRLSSYVGQFGGFGNLPGFQRWLRWGGTTTLATDALDHARVLGVTGQVHFVSPLNGSQVPFTELIDVGGPGGILSGFWAGRIRAMSAAGLSVHYTWPIWVFLDARLFFETGNAFGDYLEQFDLELLRMSFGLAIRPRLPGETPFDMRLALGTDTFERGASIQSVRFLFGTRSRLL